MIEYATIIQAKIKEFVGYRPGLGQDGYGRKISTDYMVKIQGQPRSQWLRVYCISCSNSGSLYVRSRGKSLYLDDLQLRDLIDRIQKYSH